MRESESKQTDKSDPYLCENYSLEAEKVND